MLISTESPCSHWPLGKAVDGKDGHVRSVKLQVVRSFVKLCPLELD